MYWASWDVSIVPLLSFELLRGVQKFIISFIDLTYSVDKHAILPNEPFFSLTIQKL